MGEHVYTYDDPPSERDLRNAIRILDGDGLIAYQADGNWAFGCNAASPKALDRIRALKPTHPKDQPFSLLCSDVSMAANVANIDNAAYRYLKKAWPGPYTVILERNRNLARQIKDKRKVVGVRVPACPMLLELIRRYGHPLASTSAPLTKDGLMYKFGYEIYTNFGHALDLVLDLGNEAPGVDTTVVDMTSGAPELIRLGLGDPGLFDLG